MKIITLHQPYASLIAYGLKRFETRTWATKYRGPLVIHAAKRPFVSADGNTIKNREYYEAWQAALALAESWESPLPHELPLGAVVAIVNLKDCRKMTYNIAAHHDIKSAQIITHQRLLERSLGNWTPGNYAWELSQLQQLMAPIPYRGGQGLRNVPTELGDAIAAALT